MPRGPGKKPLPPTGRFPSSSNGFELQKGNLTHHQRLVIVRKKDEEPRWTQEDLARWAKKQFGLLRQPTQSTISNILRSREKLETMTTSLDAKSARPVKHPELDAALLLWLRDRQSQQRATTGDELRDQAKQLADACQYSDEMTYSNGWMRGFLTRHGIPFRRNQVDPRELHTLHDIQVAAAGYARQDVFTFVSTTLWYRAEPKKDRVGVSDNVGPAGDDTEPALCVGLAVNMDGSEKWSPVMVSRAKQPPSFQQKTAFQWGFHEYYFNGHAQMTSTIFEVWVKRLNQRMAQSNRRVLLIVDSAPSHLNATLSHVQVMIHADVPQLHLTPLRAEIAHAFKAFYRKKQLASAVDRAEAGARDRFAVSQLKAMRWVEQAWGEVPSEFVVSAWASVALAPLPIAIAEAQYPQSTPKKNEIHAALTELLEQLDVPGRVKSHEVVTPRGEDDAPHYVYSDATIMPLVIGALHPRAGAVDESDMVDVAELTLPPDASSAATQQHRALLLKLEQLRGVIQSLDEEAPPGEELTSVLEFLRRRQATLRAELQRLAREAEQTPTNGQGEAVAPAAPVSVPVSAPAPTVAAEAAAMAAASVIL